MLNAKLVVVGGDAKAKEIELKLPCVIGRGREATLTLPHPLVSRQHTEIFEMKGKLYVRDLGSLNGTFLNNRRLETAEPLEPNQLLTLGNVTFRAIYEIGDSAETSPSAATETLGRKTEAAEPTSTRDSSVSVIAERETVYDDALSAGDTDKSILGTTGEPSHEQMSAPSQHPASGSGVRSDVFTGVETGQDQPSGVSSVEGLPESPAAMSFSGGIDPGEGREAKPPVDSVNLEIDDPHSKQAAADSTLDSFIRKLPK